jgi:two-component system chemotaxis response regulator CheY
MSAKRIVLVGHCGPDGFALKSALQSFAPGAVVESVGDEEAASRAALASDLLVVNRLLDGEFDVPSGVELIRQLALRGVAARLMLVSNFRDAQEEAEAAGAVPGFGKRDLYAEATRRKVRDSLGLD